MYRLTFVAGGSVEQPIDAAESAQATSFRYNWVKMLCHFQ